MKRVSKYKIKDVSRNSLQKTGLATSITLPFFPPHLIDAQEKKELKPGRQAPVDHIRQKLGVW